MQRWNLVLIGLALAAAAARADIDVESGPALKAKSTLLPEGEVESYSFRATAGTKLTFALTVGRGAHLQFTPALTDPDGHAVALGAGVLVTSAKGASVRGLPLTLTGAYRLDVSATGTGDYGLALTAAAQTRFGMTSDLAASQSQVAQFSAPPGSTVTLSAKAAKGSAAAPRFGQLVGVDYAHPLGTEGRFTATSHTVKVTGVGGTGNLIADFTNTGAAGSVVVSISVKPPKSKLTKLDLRGLRLGRPSGGETFVARVVGPGGGTVTVEDLTSDLAGASVSVPAGALAASLPVSVSSAGAQTLPSRDDQAAGPAVDLRPSGTKFKSAVTVTLPFDFSRLPAGASAADIRVLVVEADGSTSTFVPLSFDTALGTVTLQVSGFSVCVPIVRSGIPRIGLTPGGDEYWTLFVTHEMFTDQGANDSRGRSYGVAVGEASFFGDGTVQYSANSRFVSVDNRDNQSGGIDGSVQFVAQPESGTGTWTYNADGRSIDIATGDQDAPALRVSRDGSAMVGVGRPSTSEKAELDLLLRKNKDPLTTASLDGTWHLVAFDLHAQSDSPGQPVHLDTDHVLGTMAFDGAGGYRIVATQRGSGFDQGAGTWQDKVETISAKGSYEVEAAGTVLVNIPPDQPGDNGNVFRLFPGTGAQTFLGADRDPQNGDIFAIVLVKQGSGLSAKSLSGPYRSSDIEIDTDTYTVGVQGPSVTVGDLTMQDEDLSVTFDGTASATFAALRHEVRRNPSVAGGVEVRNEASTFGVNLTVGSNGTLRFVDQQEGGGVVGAISPDAMFGFFVTDLKGSSQAGSHTVGFLIKSAPAER